VQSHRGLVERMFARLKKWQILIGGAIDSIDFLEMEMDAAMALQNLNERFRLDIVDGIPDRAPCPPGAHIITRDLDPNMEIGKSMTLENARFPSHWKTFMSEMTSVIPDIDKILSADDHYYIFSKRVRKRGENLFLGGNVAQISCKIMENDVYRVQARVYASMKAVCYTTFVDLQKGDGVLRAVCACKNG
jgi:hypothetical protein